MKLQFKLLALYAALAATGAAHADLIGANVVGSSGSSLALVAFNQVTNAYYVRDLGFTLNQFLPTGTTPGAGDNAGVIADKTPEAGLTLDKTTNASFADSAFSVWFSAQTAADVRWTITAGDDRSAAGQGQQRTIVSGNSPLAQTNGTVRGGVASSGGVTGLAAQNNPFTLSTTGATVLNSFLENQGLGANSLATVGTAASLYYYVTTQATGASATSALTTQFGNSLNFAQVLLASNGDFSYTLAPAAAVPVPGAVWLMGVGLAAMGGVIRRRKAAAAEA